MNGYELSVRGGGCQIAMSVTCVQGPRLQWSERYSMQRRACPVSLRCYALHLDLHSHQLCQKSFRLGRVWAKRGQWRDWPMATGHFILKLRYSYCLMGD